MRNARPFLIIGVVLVAAVIGGFLLIRSRSNQPGFAPGNPPGNANAPRKIPNDVVVTLEEFGDYQCPSCAALAPTLNKLKQDFGVNLNFVFRNLPLVSIHKNSLVAAQAAEAARRQNKFWEMHDLLYQNQDLWKDDINPRSIFLKFALDLQLDTARFAKDMDDREVQLRIQADLDAATQLGINGTPTVLIEGRQLKPETTTPDGIRKGIEFMLQQKASS
jgi:protein-disulfide isomerase